MSRLFNVFNKFSQHMATTEPGQQMMMWTVGIGSSSIMGGYILAHTFFIDKYRDIVQLYRHGITREVSPKIRARIHRVIEDMKIPVRFREYIDSFYVQGLDPFHIGSLQLNCGAYIGLPGSFDYQTKADIETNMIVVNNEHISWSSEYGELLKGSIILSDKAQRFAIAREINHLNTHYVYLNGFISSMVVVLHYWLTATGNRLTYGHQKPRSFRMALYGLVGVFTFGIWSSSIDLLRKYHENYADRKASSLGLDYAQGGVEFYTKLVQRNMAIRELMGPRGERLFTKFGNDNELLRQRHVPLSIRKENAEKMVQKYLESNNNKSDEVKSEAKL